MIKILLALLLAIMSADVVKPHGSLRVNPRMGHAPVDVLAIMLIVNPGQLLYCSDLTWDWGNGTRSFHSADCDPTEAIPVRWVESRRHVYGVPGEYIITVSLSKSGRVITQLRTNILLM